MEDKIINELALLAGEPLFADDIDIKPLKLRDIAKAGEYYYNMLLSLLCIEIDDLKKFIEIKDDYKNTYDFIHSQLYNKKELHLLILDAINMFIQKPFLVDKKGFFYLVNEDKTKKPLIMDEKKFYKVVSIIKRQNCIKDKEIEEKPIFANKRAEEMWNQIQENEKKIQIAKAKEISLYSIISAIAWKSHIGINDVWDLTIYQLYDAHSRLQIIDNYDNTLTGIYSGTVDQKKVNPKDINWAKVTDNS